MHADPGTKYALILIAVTLSVIAPNPWTTSRPVTPTPSAEAQQQSRETRQRLLLPRAERAKVLAEMRRMLESVNGIAQGLVSNDLAAIEKAARASGMASAADVDPQVENRLPPMFLTLGVQTHKGFDNLADRIKARGTREDVIKGLDGLTANCVTCHAIYRIDEGR